MQVSMLTRYAVSLVCAMGAGLSFHGEAWAERAIVQVTPGEYRRLGYQDKDEFTELYGRCVQVAKELSKKNVCADDDCVKKSQEWKANGCEKHSTTAYYLTSIDPARYPVSEIFDNSEKANYVRLYTGSCQDGYKAMNPGGDVSLVKNICECAATQSLDLIEYSDYKAFESTNASKDVIARVKNRASYARFICENKPAVWREQSSDIGASVAGNSGVASAAAANPANLDDARLIGLFDQLRGQGTALYNSLLMKLKAEAGNRACQADPLCGRVNETLGAIYKDVLYTAYATQIYKTTGPETRPLARTRLNDFVKAALLSVEPNVKYVRVAVGGTRGDNNDLLAKAIADAENCHHALVNISRELDRK